MQVLVTGSSGYIGSVTVKHLAQKGYDVYGLDLLEPPLNVRKYLKDYLVINYGSKTGLVEKFIRKKNIKHVIHFAATSLVGPSIDFPLVYHKNNVIDFTEFLNVLKKCKIERFVFASSAAVYKSSKNTLSEINDTVPANPYGTTKLIGELLVEHSELPYVCLRYFNVIGTDYEIEIGQGISPKHILANAVMHSLMKKKFYIYGNKYATPDGTCVRDYVSVNDVAEATITALESSRALEEHAINIATGVGRSNWEITELVNLNTKNGLTYKFVAPRAGDPDYLVADITLAQNAFSYAPKDTDVEEIIRRVEFWYKGKINEQPPR
jgi:UDP-glucose 4-epimerase